MIRDSYRIDFMNEPVDQSDLPVAITPADLDRSRCGTGRRLLPPPNYAGRAMRLRLYVLVGSLLLVMVLMEQVRDPDLWRRIGFTEQPAGAKTGEPVWTEVRIAPPGSDSQQEQEAEPAGKNISDQTGSEAAGESGTEAKNGDDQSAVATTDSAEELWRGLFRGLTPEELNLIAARMVAGSGPDPDTGIAGVAQTLDRRMGSEVTLRLEQIAGISRSDRPRAAAMAESIARTQIEWRETIRPWLEQDSPFDGSAAIFVPFELALRAVAIERIEDRTGPARVVEGAAWLFALQQSSRIVRLFNPLPEPRVYQMMTMPSEYRAHPVRFSGQLLGTESVKTAGNALGVDRYWVLWMGDDSGGNVPACIYLTEKPEDIPGSELEFTKCNLPVRIDGIFFKLRTYIASDRSSAVCPLILATYATVIPDNAAKADVAADSGGLPEGWPWIIAGLITLAGGVAWIAWKNTHAGLKHPEPAGLRAGLKSLANDSEILTDREQVARLQERNQS